jgi:hypothetical protein
MKLLQDSFENPLHPDEVKRLMAEATRRDETPLTDDAPPQPQSSDIGKQFGDSGIYLGVWDPPTLLYNSYHVFVAPTDLIDPTDGLRICTDFRRAVDEVSKLKNWKGHDGCKILSEGELLIALDENKYHGEWFIPPVGLMAGWDFTRGVAVTPSVFAQKEEFAKTFPPSDDFQGAWYWTCSSPKHANDKVWAVNCENSNSFAYDKVTPLRIRPLRLELVP